ncbi:MAG: helix-turn-helix transcriptional regulator [Rubricoccaceae bacterium]|nr:helix-turn-helix transcriptional regulator [Rubricoccaceae bacterium]
MALSLSTGDLARLEAATRALVSPLAVPDVDAWRREVNAQIGQLLGGRHTLFRLPTGDGAHYTDDGHDITAGLMAFAQEVTPDMITYWDEAPNVWHTDRRPLGIEAFTWEVVAEVVRRRGLSVDRAPVWNEVFFQNGVRDYAGLITTRPEGDAILWSLGPRLGTTDRGTQLPMLTMLVPAFKAGLDALDRLGAHRAALDAVAEPLAAFDADGRETYRNEALIRLLAADPEAALAEAVLTELARRARPVGFARWGETAAGAPVTAEVRTARARYTFRAVLLPPSGHAFGDAFLVTVAADGGVPALPTAEEIRARCGLSKREAEVALLVAQGLSNDEIAEALFVSKHTVRHHVESVMAKLELTGRGREAVAPRLLQAACPA